MSLLASGGGGVVSHLVDGEIFGRIFTHHHWLLIVVAVIMVLLFRWVARNAEKREGSPKGFQSLIEVTLVWIRDEIVYPSMGAHNGRKYLYFFWTLFFFILGSNLLGLIPFLPPINPFGKAATGNIMVTGALAIITFLMVQISGMRKHGWGKYWINLVPGGVPAALWPLVWAIEFVGLIAKPFALTVRLFANMTAGHAILAVLVGFFMGVRHYDSALIGGLSSIGTFAFYLFIMLFETLVALIQAYIFTILSAIFVGMALAEEH